MNKKHRKFFIALWLMPALLLTSASAQETKGSKPEQVPTSATPKTVINLWPGIAPGSEDWKQPETTLRPGAIGNVTTPTLTVYLPSPSTATGTAVAAIILRAPTISTSEARRICRPSFTEFAQGRDVSSPK